MARPKKFNASYFSHDTNMRNHRKILALRQKYGLVWYAIYNMLLEHIASCDYFTAKWDENEQELLAGDFWISVAEMKQSVDFCGRMNLVQIKDGSICCQSLSDRLQDLVQKRERERSRFLWQSVAESTQIKEKEIKTKEIKEKSQDQKFSDAQRRSEVNSKWKFLLTERNQITGRNDLMENNAFRWFEKFIMETTVEDFKKRVETFQEAVNLINEHKLGKYLNAFGNNNIQDYSITNFIDRINIFWWSVDWVFKAITTKDYISKVLRIIHPPVAEDKKEEVKTPVDPEKIKEWLDKMRNIFKK